MKLKFYRIVESRVSRDESRKRICPPTLDSRPSARSGVALIITLILLSAALVMALAFLAISSRDKGSITTQTDTATTRLAADAGLAAAEAQIAANVLSTTNPYNFGLLVSTNYLPLTNGNALLDLTNLQYSPRAPVWLTNLATHTMENRFYLDLNRNGRDDPNGWVLETNSAGLPTGNIVFEVGDPEWIGVLEFPDQPYGPKNPFIARFAFIALPVGNSLDLNTIHNQALIPPLGYPLNPMSPLDDSYFRNQGVGTWEINLAAFLADLNTNQWGQIVGSGPNPPVGSVAWYQYNQANPTPPGAFANRGAAFNDAFSLLTNRYAGNYTTLASVNNLYGGAGNNAFIQDNIDGYSDGFLQITPKTNFLFPNTALPWAGADNTNHSFTPEELFDPTKSSGGPFGGFTNRLLNAGNGISTYDRYTFYRMLSQLGTDTAPESGKMNLNYDNLVQPNLVSGAVSETNFIPWTPLSFFTNAADRLLKAYTEQWAAPYTNNEALFVTGLNANLVNTNFVATFNVTAPFGVTAIPVLISNQFVFTPAVNRLLQLAANMYDATTTNLYPDIYRPLFMHDVNGNVFIIGYELQTNFITGADTMNEMNPALNPDLGPPLEVAALTNLFLANTLIDANVYGVPWIIGAKKGFPNFNAFSVESAFQLIRKLEVLRDTNAVTQPDIILTNQMYLMNITNYMALSCWNSYRSNYAGPADILVRCASSIMLTNDNNLNPPYVFRTNFASVQEYAPNWPAWNGVPKSTSGSFIVPLSASVLTLTNAIYFYNGIFPANSGELLNYIGDNPSNYLDRGIQPLPHFGLLTTNRLQVVIIDYSTNVSPLNVSGPTVGRIVDYVQLGGMDSSQSLNSALPENDFNSLWDTNYYPDANGVLLGVYNQIHVSMTGATVGGQGTWSTAAIPGGPSSFANPAEQQAAQQAFFRAFFSANGVYPFGGQFYVNTQTAIQAPYTPMAFAILHTTWGANDPLVHYLSSDLAAHTETPAVVDWDPNKLRVTNDRYQPWGQPPPTYVSGIDTSVANLSFKDPLVRASDDWDFPAGKLPTVGWLGRVHRGTPWQTVYLKASDILAETNLANPFLGVNTWVNWTGDLNLFDMSNSAPVGDRLLFDLFTTAFNDNATRGQLSVNISSNSLAAWSAVFSGVTVLTNNLPNANAGFPLRYQNPLPRYLSPGYTNMPISPAGVYNSALPLAQQPQLAQLVAGIDQTRATFTNRDGLVGAFEHKGDILAVPQLTEQSPFLNWPSAAQRTNGISDEMYEWVPQQVMSLLRDSSSPRYVIYSYGQTLKPAQNGIYLLATPAGMFGLVTNYQVVSEIATRAVVRFDTVRTNVIGPTPSIIVTPPRAVIESFNILPPN